MSEKALGFTVVGGKYILGHAIGKGAFGEVYLATVEGEDTLYAVKRVEGVGYRRKRQRNTLSCY